MVINISKKCRAVDARDARRDACSGPGLLPPWGAAPHDAAPTRRPPSLHQLPQHGASAAGD